MNKQLVLALCLFVGLGAALPQAAAQAASSTPDIVLRDDAKCTTCHDENDKPQVLHIGKTKHGTLADKRTGTCTSCHGKSEKHIEDADKGTKKPVLPDIAFSKRSSTPIEARNDACLTCHRKDSNRSHWMGSTHQTRDVACASCHDVHTAKDRVLDKVAQSEVCFTCHKETRTQVNRPSRHPIPEGKMSCSDCHNTHGSVGPKLVKRDSVNDTCYSCHMEKRGPFVHNHEPVQEDCAICHNPHGTVTENMLKARMPFLCHQCHTPHGGAVLQLRGQSQAISGTSGVTYTQGRGCVSCHTQVHGSNNPASGAAGLPTPRYNLR